MPPQCEPAGDGTGATEGAVEGAAGAGPVDTCRLAGAEAERDLLRDVVLERGYTRSEEPFRLSSGGTSRDYVDLRRALSRGEDLRRAARLVLALASARGAGFDAAGGLTMGADPLAHAIAVSSGCEWFAVRKAAKQHGSGRRIEGADLGPGTRVLLLEDTVSTARSGLEALEVVEATGARVVLACAVLDRAGVAAARFAERGVPYAAVLDYRDLGIEPLPLTG
jgi:orotate phosphoribosyltransferase